MAKQEARYYPRGEGVEGKAPTSCIKCGSNMFKKIERSDRNSTRYICKNKKCGQNYHIPNPEQAESAIRIDGFITDNALFDVSERENSLKLYVDKYELMSYNTIRQHINRNIQYIKMFTDDILCHLKYGDEWGIDETVISVRGEVGEPDPSIMEEFKEKYGHLRKTDEKTYNKEWKKARKKSERSKKWKIKKYLTGIVDHKTRAVIHYAVTGKRPDAGEIYNILRVAVNVGGIPREVTTDKYAAYEPAVRRLEKALKRKGKVEHISIRAENLSSLHIPDKTGRNNNIVEALWSRIKRHMRSTTYMETETAEIIVRYHVINHNFVKPHTALSKVNVDRGGVPNKVYLTPAQGGGYPLWFANFEELLRESLGYDKAFLLKLDRNMLSRIRIGIHRDNRTTLIKVRPRTPKSEVIEIDKVLQTKCGFMLDYKSQRWAKEIPSISHMLRMRKDNLLGKVPVKTFEICHRCGLLALSSHEVEMRMGYRWSNNKWITQPNCIKCRAELSRNPKRRMGPNKKKMRTKRPTVFARQKKSGEAKGQKKIVEYSDTKKER